MLLDFLVCDDVREEKSNKLTLVGVYSGFIAVATPWPALLPKLGLFIRLAPQPDFIPERYTLRIKRDAEVMAVVEGNFTITDVTQPSTIVVVGAPFPLPGPGVLRFDLTLHRGQEARVVPMDRSIEIRDQGSKRRIPSTSQA